MRIRTVKPDFFKDPDLFDLEQETGFPIRVAFEGLWCAADREGRFKWKPRPLKTDILPYDNVEFSDVLDALADHGFIVAYEVDGRRYGWIRTFKDHQKLRSDEAQSTIPPCPDEPGQTPEKDADPSRGRNEPEPSPGRGHTDQGRGRERKGKERKGGGNAREASDNRTVPKSTQSENPPPSGSQATMLEELATERGQTVEGACKALGIERLGRKDVTRVKDWLKAQKPPDPEKAALEERNARLASLKADLGLRFERDGPDAAQQWIDREDHEKNIRRQLVMHLADLKAGSGKEAMA